MMDIQFKIVFVLFLLFANCYSQPIKINKDISGIEGLKIIYLDNNNKTLPLIHSNETNIWIQHKLNATEFNSKFEEEPQSSEEMMIFRSISNDQPIEIGKEILIEENVKKEDRKEIDKRVNDGKIDIKDDRIVTDKIEDRIDQTTTNDMNDRLLSDDSIVRTQNDEKFINNEEDKEKIDRAFKQDYASLVKEFVRSTVLEELNKDYFKNNEEPLSYFGVSKREIINSLTDKNGPKIELENSRYNRHKSDIHGVESNTNTPKKIRNVHSGFYGGVQMFSRGKNYASGIYKKEATDVIYDPNPKDDDRSYESQLKFNRPSHDYYKSTSSNSPSVHEITSTEELEASFEESRKFKPIIDSLDNYPSVKYPKTSKHIYVHVPPPESSEEEEIPKNKESPPPEKHYKIIFIKTPQQKIKQPVIPPLPQKEEKTLVYVLVKKPEDVTVKIPTPASTLPSKPEVYYIRYKERKDDAKETEDDLEYGAADNTEVTVPSNGGSEVTTIVTTQTVEEEKQER